MRGQAVFWGGAVIAETLESRWQVIMAQWGGQPDWCRPEIESLSTLQVSNPIPKPLARYPQQAGFGLGPCVSSVPPGVYISSSRKWKGTVDQAEHPTYPGPAQGLIRAPSCSALTPTPHSFPGSGNSINKGGAIPASQGHFPLPNRTLFQPW